MYLRLLPGVAAILFVAGPASAQCVNGQCPTSGPVRSIVAAIPRPHLAVSAGFTREPMFADGPVRMLWRTRPGVVFPVRRAVPVAAPAKSAPVVSAATPQVVGAPGDRLKARLLSEIRQLHDLEQAGKLTPDQWARLLALIELFVRLFVHQPSPSP